MKGGLDDDDEYEKKRVCVGRACSLLNDKAFRQDVVSVAFVLVVMLMFALSSSS